MASLIERLNKRILNVGRLRVMQLRGVGVRALRPAIIKGGRLLLVGCNVSFDIYGEIEIGDRVTLADGCALEVGPSGRLVIGNDVFVGRNSVIRAHGMITLDDRCTIAEHCTVRDQGHNVDPQRRLAETGVSADPVRLGKNVWLGAGVRVLKGSTVGDGSVVAANAVVRGAFPGDVVIGGIPARILRSASERPDDPPVIRGGNGG